MSAFRIKTSNVPRKRSSFALFIASPVVSQGEYRGSHRIARGMLNRGENRRSRLIRLRRVSAVSDPAHHATADYRFLFISWHLRHDWKSRPGSFSRLKGVFPQPVNLAIIWRGFAGDKSRNT